MDNSQVRYQNEHLKAVISSSLVDWCADADLGPNPRTELDSHANMVVLCNHAYVFDMVNNDTCDVLKKMQFAKSFFKLFTQPCHNTCKPC